MGGSKMTIYEVISLAINLAILILSLLSYLKK
ncbi:MAG: putative holin-like toxin [Treponema sp.]|nr:putative holin-like toxin [Treponema sp.]